MIPSPNLLIYEGRNVILTSGRSHLILSGPYEVTHQFVLSLLEDSIRNWCDQLISSPQVKTIQACTWTHEPDEKNLNDSGTPVPLSELPMEYPWTNKEPS